MNKDEIIKYAESLGFHLDYDKWDNPDKGEFSNGDWLRFQLPNNLDEKDLRWIWYKDKSDDWNINNGLIILKRGIKKKQIQEFLKY